MAFETLLWLTAHIGLSALTGWFFLRWCKSPSATPRRTLALGLTAVGINGLVLPIIKLNSSMQAHPQLLAFSSQISQQARHAMAIALVVVVAGLLLWSAGSFLVFYLHVRTVRREIVGAKAGGGDTVRKVQSLLEGIGRANAMNPWLSVVISDGFQLPFTHGWARPTVFCPSWVFALESGSATSILLTHEYKHVALGHHGLATVLSVLNRAMPWNTYWFSGVRTTMETQADQEVIREVPLDIYSELLSSAVAPSRFADAVFGIGHDPSDIPSRIARLRGDGPRSPHPAIVTSLALICGCALLWFTGGVQWGSIHEDLYQPPPAYWFVRMPSSSRPVKSMPKGKLDLAEGISVTVPPSNTSSPESSAPWLATLSVDGIDGFATPPFIDPRGINYATFSLELDYSASKDKAAPSGLRPIVHYRPESYYPRADALGSGDIRYGRGFFADIKEGKGHIRVPMYPAADWSNEKRIMVRGIWVMVPPGWTIKLRNIKLGPGGAIAHDDGWPDVLEWLRRNGPVVRPQINTGLGRLGFSL